MAVDHRGETVTELQKVFTAPLGIERAQKEIERAQEADRIARKEAQAAVQRKREMATPSAIGAVIEIKRWKPAVPPTWDRVPDTP